MALVWRHHWAWKSDLVQIVLFQLILNHQSGRIGNNSAPSAPSIWCQWNGGSENGAHPVPFISVQPLISSAQRMNIHSDCLLCREVGEAPSDTMSEEMDSEVYPSEDGKLDVRTRHSHSFPHIYFIDFWMYIYSSASYSSYSWSFFSFFKSPYRLWMDLMSRFDCKLTWFMASVPRWHWHLHLNLRWYVESILMFIIVMWCCLQLCLFLFCFFQWFFPRSWFSFSFFLSFFLSWFFSWLFSFVGFPCSRLGVPWQRHHVVWKWVGSVSTPYLISCN